MINVFLLESNSLVSALDEISVFGESEIQRLESMRAGSHRRESLGALVALHRLLLTCDRSPCRITRAEGGKPYFEGENAIPFSLSHSGGICAAAIGEPTDKSIGLDIEVLRPTRNAESIANRFFGQEELDLFCCEGKTDRAFLKLWTQKEAKSKLLGCGLFDSSTATDSPMFVHTESVFLGRSEIILSACSRAPITKVNIYK